MKTIDNIAINETIIVNNTIKITKVPNGLIYTITSIYNNNTNSKETIINTNSVYVPYIPNTDNTKPDPNIDLPPNEYTII